MRRLTAVLLLSMFAAACTGDGGDDDGPRTGAAEDSTGMTADGPVVTPAESAAAARTIQRHADSVRREVMRASGVPAEHGERTPLPRDLPKDSYESCLRQARDAEEPVKSRLEQICANLRDQPKG
jgi:hypothetical protein